MAEFYLEANVNPNTKNVQNELSKKKFTISPDIDVAKIQSEFKKISQTAQLNVSAKLNGQSFKNVNKIVETYADNMGKQYQITTLKSSETNEILAQSLTKLSEKFKPFENTTKNVSSNLNDVSKSSKTASSNLKLIEDKSKNVSSSLDNVSKSTKNVNNSLQSTESVSKKVGQSFLDISVKVAKFYAATIPIQMMQKALGEATNTVKDFDSAITEMSKVSEYSGERLRKYTQDLGDLGEEVGRTTTSMTEMATGWLKAGYSEKDAAKLSKYSALLQNTADEQLSASEATSILVSQLKAYDMQADDAIIVTDILNKVSAEEAVSSGDLAKGLTQASASMSTFGNDIYETTALLTAGTTVFQGKSQQVKMRDCLLNIA